MPVQEQHKIQMYRNHNIGDGPGLSDVVEVGRFMVDGSSGDYINQWWTNDEKRIKPLPVDMENCKINLNEGFDATKYDKVKVQKIDLKVYHALLEWIYIKAYDLAANGIRVIANSPVIYDLLQTPYSRANPDGSIGSEFTAYVTKFNGILYLFRVHAEEEKNEDFRLVKYRGKKFRQTMTENIAAGDVNKNDNAKSSKLKRRVINKASFRGVDMLYTSKVSAVDSKGRFVTLHVMPEDNLEKFSFYRKLLRHWSIAVTTPAPKMLLGLRQRHENESDPNSEVLISSFKPMTTSHIPELVAAKTVEGKRIPWEPKICYKNLEAVIDTLMAICDDDPKIVYKLETGAANEYGYYDHLLLTKLSEKESAATELLPDWYTD